MENLQDMIERSTKKDEINFTLEYKNKKFKDRTFSEAGCVTLLENISRWCEAKLISEIKNSFRNKMCLQGVEFQVKFIKHKEVTIK
ncbi:MAG TPA: hypothetical protein ENH99_00940 [Candidatus Pacearchaeota archaeon]|nr:hypothetical protein [Candidatus Pacearchaeota archaeon]